MYCTLRIGIRLRTKKFDGEATVSVREDFKKGVILQVSLYDEKVSKVWIGGSSFILGCTRVGLQIKDRSATLSRICKKFSDFRKDEHGVDRSEIDDLRECIYPLFDRYTDRSSVSTMCEVNELEQRQRKVCQRPR